VVILATAKNWVAEKNIAFKLDDVIKYVEEKFDWKIGNIDVIMRELLKIST
jgi:Holliday junction resolvase-like predicted endonuclease